MEVELAVLDSPSVIVFFRVSGDVCEPVWPSGKALGW